MTQDTGLSTLERFRMSPLYLALLKKLGKTKPLVASAKQLEANMVEKAGRWAKTRSDAGDSFGNALIAQLIKVGLNRAIVDVFVEGSQATLFMSDRLGKSSKDMHDLISEIADIGEMQKPDETRNGTFVFQIMAKEGVDFDNFLQEMLKKDIKVESTDSCFLPK